MFREAASLAGVSPSYSSLKLRDTSLPAIVVVPVHVEDLLALHTQDTVDG